MKIDRVIRYRVNGQEFETLAKAKDHVDGEVNNILRKTLIAKGLGVRETIKLTEAVLENREALAKLLSCAMPDATEWNDD